jgi:pimeloyl-ACP methyl ester carboxylesterase
MQPSHRLVRPTCMLRLLLPAFLILTAAPGTFAADHPSAREIIADLNRIVTPDGVQENFTLDVGGIKQSVYVRGQHKSNPIVLFIHGGPASPLSDAVAVRAADGGILHFRSLRPARGGQDVPDDAVEKSLRISQYVSDAIDVARVIRSKYGARKLILAGHSWGTVIALRAALERPELFHAYVGIGQVINTRTNERLSFDFGVAEAKRTGNREAIDELSSIAPYPGTVPITRERIIVARKWPQFFGGLTAYRHDSNYFFFAPLLSPEYEPADVEAIDAGNAFTLGRVLPEFLEIDYTSIKKFPIPVVMLMGRHDYTTPSKPTSEWLDAVEAPYKKAVWFEHSAHMIPWEEPGKMLLTLVNEVRPLAR